MNKSTITALVLAFSISSLTYAGEKENELIKKITHAYGGDAVVKLSSYRIEERYLSPTSGQTHSPGLGEIGLTAQILTVDIENNRAVYDTWSDGRGGGFQGSTISDGEKAYSINYQAGSYGEAQSADPKTFAGGSMRTSDTILVHELNKVKDSSKISDDEFFMNRLHHSIIMPFPNSPDLKLLVDAETFLISKMVRVNPQLGNLDYVYSKHKKNNGVSYASNINFFIAGTPNLISSKHELQFNIETSASMFALPAGFKEEGKRIDTSEMLVTKLSDRVYHIGQGSGFSLFVNTNAGVVGVGGYPGIQDRFKRFQSESENYKPFAYQVVTHHHSDHIGGLGEAVALGAKLVTVDDNVQTIMDGVRPALDKRDFFKAGPRTTFGEGRNRVEIHEVSTIHAASFLVTYVPAEKTVFIADHMGSPFAKATPIAGQGTVDMLAALDALNIDIKKIATAHNARIFTMQDMRNSVAAHKVAECVGNRPVCL